MFESIDNSKQAALQETEDRSFYGLPNKVKDMFRCLRSVTELYVWQNYILQKMCETDEIRNLVYLSPTSGGKTLVAEILLLQCLLLRRK